MLTEEQERMVVEAIGDGSDWPKFTADPQVNHAVDMKVCGEEPWDQMTEEIKKLYREAADRYKNTS